MPFSPQKAALAAFLLCFCPVLQCQQEAQTAPKSDAKALIQAALDHRKSAAASETRYTDFMLKHDLNFNEKGKKTREGLELYEETWINDLPYNRLIEEKGHPLTGKALKQEQALYNDAVAGRRPLGTKERILLQKGTPVSMDTDLHDTLTARYTLRELPSEESPNGQLRVIEATTAPSNSPKCAWRYKLWISEPASILFRFHADVAPAQYTSDMCQEAFEDVSWELVDGTPKVSHIHSYFYVLGRNGRDTVESEATFTKYRRFQATVTITPVSGGPSIHVNPSQPPAKPAAPELR